MNKILSNTKGDRWIWLIVILLSLISLLAVYSAIGSLAYKRGVGAESILMKHLAMIVAGIALPFGSLIAMSFALSDATVIATSAA